MSVFVRMAFVRRQEKEHAPEKHSADDVAAADGAGRQQERRKTKGTSASHRIAGDEPRNVAPAHLISLSKAKTPEPRTNIALPGLWMSETTGQTPVGHRSA